MDEPHRPDHFGTRGPWGDHHLQPGPGRHPPGSSHRRRTSCGQRRASPSPTWCGTPGTHYVKRPPQRIPWPKPASPRPSKPVTHQRGRRPFSGEALLIDGQLFSPHLPLDLHDLPAPPRGASEEEKLNLRGQVQPAGAVAPGSTRRSRRRRRHPVALSLLCRLAPEPQGP
jgi:hypothetical protein